MRRSTFGVKALIGWVLLIALEGCGGGASTAILPDPSSTVNLGAARITYTGKPVPLTSQGGGSGVSVTGMAGASFSFFSIATQPSISACPIAYSGGSSHNDVWLYSGGVTSQLTNEIPISSSPTFSGDGSLILFSRVVGQNPVSQLFTCNRDGSSQAVMTSGTINHFNPTWSANNFYICFDDGTSVYVRNVQTAVETRLASGTNPVFDLLGNVIYSGSVSGFAHILSIPVGGGTITDLTPWASTTNCTQPTASPTANRIAFVATSNGVAHIVVEDVLAVFQRVTLPFAGSGLGWPRFTSDGKSLLYMLGTPPSIYMTSLTGNLNYSLYTYNAPPSGLSAANMAPFPRPRTFVGTTGILSTGVQSGFLWSQFQDQTACLLTFSTTTVSTGRVTQISMGQGDLVYDLHGDAISRVTFVNGLYGAPQFWAFPSSTDVLVTLNASTGQIANVAPFLVGRRVALAATKLSGNKIAGPFSAVYDSSGHNLAPHGAVQLTIEPKTGALK